MRTFERESAASMARRLDAGETTPVALVEQSLARIAALDGELHAWAHVAAEEARAAAREAEARQKAGQRLGPLDGVPVGVKDNLFVKGMPARWGSTFFQDHVPERDDIVVERLRAAGAIIMGKTSTPEFALSGRTFSPVTGHTRHPMDPRLTPGGSSGGAVASICAGMVPLGVATDAGGSTRLPAGYGGLYGLRPSNGRVPRRWGFPPMAMDFQAVGLIAGTLEDLELLYAALIGPDARDPTSQRLPPDPRVDGGIRVGWLNAYGQELVDPHVRRAVELAAKRLASLGLEVAPAAPPYDLAAIREIWGIIPVAGVARMASRFPKRWASDSSESLRPMAERGSRLSIPELVDAVDRLNAFRADVSAAWGAYDLLLMPSAAAPAWPAEDEFPREIDGKPGHPRAMNVFSTWVNAVGYPGLNVPGETHPDGRPIGVQLVGRYGAEKLLFEVARLLAA
ncbi:amidase [Roseococcus sp. YIM B11640]|uniref:amidase n=1 Tax=Roseococcus sp. YIM B11640 TaxID=3133973 RepID=UPI003C7A7729